MTNYRFVRSLMSALCCLLVTACVALPAAAWAQADQNAPPPPDTNVPSISPDSAPQDAPVRMARFSYIKGSVTWRPDVQTDWSAATMNLPIRAGAEVWVGDGGTAELQLDDGSRLRMGSGAIVTLKTLYSDAQGEFSEIACDQGLLFLHLKHDHAIYQIDTPNASVKAVGPASIRLGIGSAVDVAIHEGAATVENNSGKATLHSGQYVGLRSPDDALEARPVPSADGWDEWNMERDSQLDEHPTQHVPPSVGVVGDDLDSYGDWHDAPDYGWVWCPRGIAAGWRPYCYGHWAWVPPFGWTWVSDEPWGWAPYHYGTWCHTSWGWGWVPGPAVQYWCPAVVSFNYYHGGWAWCALGPREVRYPSGFAIGIANPGWSLFFSIGGCATYFAGGPGYCVAHPWNPGWVNAYRFGREGFASRFETNPGIVNSHFVSVNAQHGGAMFADANGFNGHGGFRSIPASEAGALRSAPTIGGQRGGGMPLAGPPGISLSRQALTPTHTLLSGTHLPESVSARPLYRAPVNSTIARHSVSDRHQFISPRSSIRNNGGGTGRYNSGSTGSTTHGNTTWRSSSGDARSAAEEARRSLGMETGRSGNSEGNRSYNSRNNGGSGGYGGSTGNSERRLSDGSRTYTGNRSSGSGASGHSGSYHNPGRTYDHYHGGSGGYSGSHSSSSGSSHSGSSGGGGHSDSGHGR
jgi:hypothetical protein